MSLFLTGVIVGASLAVLGVVFAVVTVGIHRQDRAASLGHRAGFSAGLARRVLGLHVRTPARPDDRTEDPQRAKERTTQ